MHALPSKHLRSSNLSPGSLSERMRTAAILPVKRFPLAKQRLGESVAESLRANLARAMVGDVLSSLRECPTIDATIVVTCEPSVAAAARYIDAVVVEGKGAGASHGVPSRRV